MSGRLGTTRRIASAAALVACVAVGTLACRFAAAQAPPPERTPPPGGPAEDPNKVDTRPPLPADTPRRKAREQLEVKNRDRVIFASIEDFKPVAAQNQNPREYDAWIELVLHAKKQHARDLNEFGIRELVPLDLTKPMLGAYRTELIRFDGKLVCVRRLVAPPLLELNGIPELYEARLVPLDESPLTPVSIVFTDLPESLAAVKQKAPEEWLDADGWVTASGYFFKAMSVPGERASAVVSIPVLIGKTVTPLPGPPVPAGDPTALDKDVRLYKFIKDKAPMIRNLPNEENWPEIAAYNRVILHAARFTPDELEANARTDLKFADLFEDSRADYKLSNVRFEGRLISLRRINPVNEWLVAAGVTTLFEGWLIPADEPRGNPVCIVFTEPLAGVEPAGRVNKWVSFAGYSFKLMRYESQEPDPKRPGKNLDKLAPLLIGRGPVARPDPDGYTSSVTWSAFMQMVVFGAILLIVAAAAFTWWYRGGDRQAKEQMDAVRHRNPFDPTDAPPA